MMVKKWIEREKYVAIHGQTLRFRIVKYLILVAQADLGDFDAALVTQERALAIGKGVYAPEHPEVARTLSNLGLVQERLDDSMPPG